MAFVLPQDWQQVLAEELKQPYLLELKSFLENERKQYSIYPPEEDLFSALAWTPYDQVKVLLLGQDPYHNDGQAHGLSFSVRPGVSLPPSLKNMFKELEEVSGTPRSQQRTSDTLGAPGGVNAEHRPDGAGS